jgi:hypothetical protein
MESFSTAPNPNAPPLTLDALMAALDDLYDVVRPMPSMYVLSKRALTFHRLMAKKYGGFETKIGKHRMHLQLRNSRWHVRRV